MAKTPTEKPDDPQIRHSDYDPQTPVPINPDDLKTEQMKGGKDPVSDAVNPKPLEELQVVKVAPREPYPGGPEPDPEDAFVAAHGFRRAKE
jgi:hypothetical protein